MPTEEFGWFANKNLIGEYHHDDLSGLNWLLKEAGSTSVIDRILLGGSFISLMINGVWLAMGVAVSTATALLGVLISACVFVYELYGCDASVRDREGLRRD